MNIVRWIKLLAVAGVALLCFTANWMFQHNRHFAERAAVTEMAFDPAGVSLYGAGDSKPPTVDSGFIAAWDVASGKLRWQERVQSQTGDVAVAPDNSRVANMQWSVLEPALQPEIWVRDARTGQAQWHYRLTREATVSAFLLRRPVFSPDSRRLFIVSTDGIRVCDAATGRKIAFWTLDGKADTSLDQVSANRDGKTLLIQTNSNVYGGHNDEDDEVQLWDARDGHLIRGIARGANHLARLSPSETRVVVAGGEKATISLKDVATGTTIGATVQIPVKANEGLTRARFIDENRIEVTGRQADRDGAERLRYWIWDTNARTLREVMLSYQADRATGSPDGRAVAIGNRADGTHLSTSFTLHDAVTGRKIYDFESLTDR